MEAKTRLINFVIDSLFYLLLSVGFIWLVKDYLQKDDARVIFISGYFIYFFISEQIFGQTVGKKITNTRVVREDTKTKPSIIQILIRTIVRIIPLYFLSHPFIGKGLHDYFSKTILIKT